MMEKYQIQNFNYRLKTEKMNRIAKAHQGAQPRGEIILGCMHAP